MNLYCVNVWMEMIDIRDGFKQCYILSSDHIDFIIEDICINWFLKVFTYKTNQMYYYFVIMCEWRYYYFIIL